MNQFPTWEEDIKKGNRFKFGRNWLNFVNNISDLQIGEAKKSLIDLVNVDNLKGKTFLDIGCGSGLMSLVARQMGAKVVSFDFDRNSVCCTKFLKEKFLPGDNEWHIEEGSILDTKYLKKIEEFDIVYSWGVLHHSGDMWTSLENVLIPLKNKNGTLIIAIYNDQGYKSYFWSKIKKVYNKNFFGFLLIFILFIPTYFFLNLLIGLILYKNPISTFKNYKKSRGMSIYHDWIDWLGGYPYEFAKPEEIFSFYKSRGFNLINFITTNSLGCNQFVFKN